MIYLRDMEEENLKSEGKCIFCEKTYGQRGIIRHISTHLSKMEKEGHEPGVSFLVNARVGPFFLVFWMDGLATLNLLDGQMREIWLECCGHMSSFDDAESKRNWTFQDYDTDEFGIPMSTRAKNHFVKGKKYDYQYDFGTTTEIDIEIKGQFSIAAPEPVKLLSRNEPLDMKCDSCDQKAAELICTVHIFSPDDSFFCPNCAKAHTKSCEDFADYATLPVVNSPRMGICGYDGGTMDKERDGLFTA